MVCNLVAKGIEKPKVLIWGVVTYLSHNLKHKFFALGRKSRPNCHKFQTSGLTGFSLGFCGYNVYVVDVIGSHFPKSTAKAAEDRKASISVTRKQSPYVYKSGPKTISIEK